VPRAYLEKLDKLHEDFIWKETKWHAVLDGDNDEEAVWQELCVALRGWFAEAGETFKAQRAIKVTSERETNLTVMMNCAQRALAALQEQSPEGRASKRAKAESEAVAVA
jgi:hypothetical protein